MGNRLLGYAGDIPRINLSDRVELAAERAKTRLVSEIFSAGRDPGMGGGVVIYNRILLRNWHKEPKSDFSKLQRFSPASRRPHSHRDHPRPTPGLQSHAGHGKHEKNNLATLILFNNKKHKTSSPEKSENFRKKCYII